ncbi:MAG: ABC-F family ATP-binding cassette domain-containing protein, partial [Christensenellaceae bacterium]
HYTDIKQHKEVKILALLAAENITKGYTEKNLLENVSLYVEKGDKIGVVGVNGTGKSTLLRIIAQQDFCDSGTITKSSDVRISYLPQNPVFEQNHTVLEQVFLGISKDIRQAKQYEAKSILTRLGIIDFNKDVNLLSGGQKKRVAIASALIHPCEILILDEPTNHIDNEMVSWLEEYLEKYSGAIIMVTHDRYFLDRVTNRIIEISKGNLYNYVANYSGFLEQKAQREEMNQNTLRKQKSLLRKELDWMMQGPRARGTKSKSRIQRFEDLSIKTQTEQSTDLKFDSVSSRLGKKIIEINDVSISYGASPLINHFSYNILRTDRIGIVGKNGCGKSTLLKIINGSIQADFGIVSHGQTVKIGYFSQECEEMDLSARVIDYIKDTSNSIQTADGVLTASQMLEKFLFSGDLQWNTIGRLSGGERRRLYLLKILMSAPNILLLDEPTNDLDIQTLMVLEEYIETFSGAVVTVSHDRYFLDKTAERIFAFENDTIAFYNGGYSDYIQQRTLPLEETAAPKAKIPQQKSKKLKFSFAEQREYSEIDMIIEKVEIELAQKESEIENNASSFELLPTLLQQKQEIEQRLEQKMERWMYLSDLAQKIELQNKETSK